MTALALTNPVSQFFDLDGKPLQGGFLYFGTANLNPTTSPVTVYWDSAATQPAAQPIRTSGGFPVRNGTPAAIYANGDVSMLVLNSSGQQIIYAKNSAEVGAAAQVNATLNAFIVALADATGLSNGDAMMAVKALLTGAVATTQHEVNSRTVSLHDFLSPTQKADVDSYTGSIGVSSALQAAIAAIYSTGGAGTIMVENGAYLLDSVASSDSKPNGVLFPFDASRKYVRTPIRLIGKGGATFKAGANNQYMIRVSRQNVEVSGIWVDRNGYTGVTFCGIVPEDRTQTSTQVNQSHFYSEDCGNTYLGDGVLRGVDCMYEFQPGPTVGGKDSGCFLHSIVRPKQLDGGTLIKATRNADHATNYNCPTRTMILHPQAQNNSGAVLDLDAVGDLTIIEPAFEGHAIGIKLVAVSGSHPRRIRCIGGYFESGTVDINTEATSGIDLYGTIYDTAKVTGAGAKNVCYRQVDGWQIGYDTVGATARASVDSAGSLTLESDPTNTRATSITRIKNDGTTNLAVTPYLKCNDGAVDETGSYHEIASATSSQPMLRFKNTHASTPTGVQVNFSAAAPNNTTQYFLAAADNVSTKFVVYSSGAVQNPTGTIGVISDAALKNNITDALSTWEKVKRYRWVNYYLNDSPESGKLLGLVAQEAREVSPGVVYEAPEFVKDENGVVVASDRTLLGVKASIVTLQHHIALQEALRRIEALEARMTP